MYLKKWMAVLGVGMLVLTTGCGSSEKTLACTKSEDSTGMTMNQDVKIKFKGKEVSKLDMAVDVVVDDEYKDYMSTLESSLKSQFSNYQDKKGITFKTSSKEQTITISVDADFSKMDDEAKEALNIVDTKQSYDDAKKELEDQKYKCK